MAKNRSILCFCAGRVVAIVIVAVSGAAVWTVGAAIGIYMWRNRTIQKKRKGRRFITSFSNVLKLNYKIFTHNFFHLVLGSR